MIGAGQAGLAAGFYLHRMARDAARGRGGPFQAAAPVAETSGGARVIPVRVSPAQITQR